MNATFIYPLLREWGFSNGNMQVPSLLAKYPYSDKLFVDIGLGSDAQETITALKNDWICISVEPSATNIKSITHRLKNEKLYHKITILNCDIGSPGCVLSAGHSYLIHGAVGDTNRYVHTRGSGPMTQISTSASGERVLSFSLEQIIPRWTKRVDFIKVDTQGFEGKVLSSIDSLLDRVRVKYIMFEFSPWIMKQHSFGDPRGLLSRFPKMGAVCFDMMGQHNRLPRPDHLENYYKRLNSGGNSQINRQTLLTDHVGPWEDILCYFPD